MKHLNYNHLLYFWTVAREGTIAKASQALHLTPQTISGQLKLLEESVGQPLFERVGRGLVLSPAGQTVQQYAEEIFLLGAELAERMQQAEPTAAASLRVGIVNSIAKLIAYRILAPLLSGDNAIRVICREGDLEQLLGQLALHQLDLVISDRPIPIGLNVKAYSHHLGQSALAMFAPRREAHRYTRDFPRSLDQANMLLPATASAMRRGLNDWFEKHGLRPRVVAEFDDSALLKIFGEAGVGLFPAPAAIDAHVEQMYSARRIGLLEDLSESYFAISPERKLKHPAVRSIIETARASLLG